MGTATRIQLQQLLALRFALLAKRCKCLLSWGTTESSVSARSQPRSVERPARPPVYAPRYTCIVSVALVVLACTASPAAVKLVQPNIMIFLLSSFTCHTTGLPCSRANHCLPSGYRCWPPLLPRAPHLNPWISDKHAANELEFEAEIDVRSQFSAVGAMAFVASKSLLVIAGSAPSTASSGVGGDGRAGAGGGGVPAYLRAWRATNTAPYFESVDMSHDDKDSEGEGALDTAKENNDRTRSRSFDAAAAQSPSAVALAAVFDIAVSPTGAEIAAVDCRGRITVVQLPSLRTASIYPGREVAMSISKQAPGTAIATTGKGVGAGIGYTGVIELGWWSTTSLVVSDAAGSVAVLMLPDLLNRFVSNGVESVASFGNGAGNIPGFYVLSCPPLEDGASGRGGVDRDVEGDGDGDTVDDNNNGGGSNGDGRSGNLWITCYTETTPSGLVNSKALAADYDGALEVASVYGLDCDAVHKTRWECEPITLNSVRDALGAISDHVYIASQLAIAEEGKCSGSNANPKPSGRGTCGCAAVS